MLPLNPRSASSAQSTACAVPSCSDCRAKRTGAPGNCRDSSCSTAAAWWPTTTTTGDASSASAARMGKNAIGRPAAACSTFALSDFIRVPLPAASTTAAIFCPTFDKALPLRSGPRLVGSRAPPAKCMPHVSVTAMFVDLHLHADGIPGADLATLAYFGVKAAVTCARDAGAGSALDLRKHWDELVGLQTGRLERAGIRPMVALALHPARIPWHGVDELLQRLPHYFDDPRAVALGELGLQEGGEREEEVFSRQLELRTRVFWEGPEAFLRP